jgi:hypothetical protein
MDPNQGSTSSGLNFQRIVLIIAIIMLIAAMIFIGYALYRQTSDIAWPPEMPTCPDYWTVNADGKTCTNTHNIKNCEYNGIPGIPVGQGMLPGPGTCPPMT